MQQSTGRFSDNLEMDKFKKDLSEVQVSQLQKLPTLAIGEVVDIKGVKFRVTRIKANGKLGLKMLVIPG